MEPGRIISTVAVSERLGNRLDGLTGLASFVATDQGVALPGEFSEAFHGGDLLGIVLIQRE
jgi:hypothetical protein